MAVDKKSYNKAYYEANKDRLLAKNRAYRQDNKERLATKQREYYLSNRESIIKRNKAYTIAHKEDQQLKYAPHKRAYAAARRRNSPIIRLSDNMRRRLHRALSGKTRSMSAVRDLGCSIGQFRLYIENQFDPGMSWGNYGSKWHLDHVIPVSHFDMDDKTQQLEAFNWLNYQPLWAKDNQMKSNKLITRMEEYNGS